MKARTLGYKLNWNHLDGTLMTVRSISLEKLLRHFDELVFKNKDSIALFEKVDGEWKVIKKHGEIPCGLPMAKFKSASETQTKWGSNKCPYASGMVEGGWYELESVEVHSSRTAFYFKGFKGHFNSVCFELNELGDKMLEEAMEEWR